MKKIILCFAASLTISFLYSQKILRKDTLTPLWKGKEFLFTDTFFTNRMEQPFKQIAPQVKKIKPGNRMPNSLPVTGFNNNEFHFLLNNKNGFDIYENSRDGMFILKPDSAFISNMPVAGKQKE